MLFADKLGMPKKIKDLAESLDLEVTNHHDPEFDAKLCALIIWRIDWQVSKLSRTNKKNWWPA